MRLPERLPVLEGRWFAAYRVLWWAALAAAILAVTAGNWVIRSHNRWLDQAIYGAGLRVIEGGPIITVAPLGETTSRRFPAGSRLIAVDGRTMPSESNETSYTVLARALGHDRRIVRLTLQPPSGPPVTLNVKRGPHHLTQADRNAPMSYATRRMLSAAAEIFVSVLLIVTAALLFRGRPRDPVAALLSIGFLLIVVILSEAAWTESVWSFAITVAVATVATTSLFLAIATFPSGRFTPRWTLAVIPLMAVCAVSPLLPAATQALVPIVFLSTASLAVAALGWRFYRLPPGTERQQIKWVVLTMAIWLVITLSYNVTRLYEGHVADQYLHFALLIYRELAGPLSFVVLCVGLLVSLLRYRLYDADAAISRSATVATLGLGLIAVFTATEKMIESIGAQWFGGSIGSAGGAIAAGAAAALLGPMHRRIDRWTERRFQGQLVLLRELPEQLDSLRDAAGTERIGTVALERIVEALRTKGGAIKLQDGVQIASQGTLGDDAIAIPLEDKSYGQIGTLLLGYRPDGTIFGKDERAALDSVVGPVARALSIAHARETKEQLWMKKIAELEARLTPIETALPDPASVGRAHS